MKTIAIISQKGGAGKTTVALHLAVGAVLDGLNTLVIDLDPQASSSNWSDRRQDELPVVVSTHASRLEQTLKTARENGGELVILDTAPHSDSIALDAARASDLVLIPCRPSILDIEAIRNSASLVGTTGKPAVGVLNAVAPQGSEADEAAQTIGEQGLEVCPVRLVNRVAFARSLVTGQTAQEYEPEGKAAEEIRMLHAFMCERMQVFTHSGERKHVGKGKQVQRRA